MKKTPRVTKINYWNSKDFSQHIAMVLPHYIYSWLEKRVSLATSGYAQIVKQLSSTCRETDKKISDIEQNICCSSYLTPRSNNVHDNTSNQGRSEFTGVIALETYHRLDIDK